MSSWDDPIFENGFTFDGNFDNGPKFVIKGFTFDNMHQGWLSDISKNAIDLSMDAKIATNKKKKLIISVTTTGGVAEVLNRAKRMGYEHLRIFIYSDTNREKLSKTLIFYGLKQVGQPQYLSLPKFNFGKKPVEIVLDKIPIQLFTFTYQSMNSV